MLPCDLALETNSLLAFKPILSNIILKAEPKAIEYAVCCNFLVCSGFHVLVSFYKTRLGQKLLYSFRIEVAGGLTLLVEKNIYFPVFFLDDNIFLDRWKISLSFTTSVEPTLIPVIGEYFCCGPLVCFLKPEDQL